MQLMSYVALGDVSHLAISMLIFGRFLLTAYGYSH